MDLNPEVHIVPFLTRPDEAKQVLEYEKQRGQRLIADGNIYRYRADLTKTHLTKLQGLTTVLKDLYWPAYSPFQRRYKGSGQYRRKTDPRKRSLEAAAEGMAKRRRLVAPLKPQPPNAHEQNTPQTSAVNLTTGADRGTMVHHHLSDYITLNAQEFARRHPQSHDWVERVANALVQEEYYPIASELAVCDVEMGVAFRIDLWCVRPSGRCVVVELKTAASADLFFLAEPIDPAHPELGLQRLVRQRPDSDYTRALLEVGVGAFMATRCMKLVCDFDALIVLITPAEIKLIPVSRADMTELIVNVYADMLSEVPARQLELQTKQRQRQEERKRAKALVLLPETVQQPSPPPPTHPISPRPDTLSSSSDCSSSGGSSYADDPVW